MSTNRFHLSVCILVITTLTAFKNRATAEELKWGDLQVRFVCDGEVPKPKRLVDQNSPTGEEILDESLLVDPKSRGVANVVVWLRAQKTNPPDVHPSYEKTEDGSVNWVLEDCRYKPHVQAICRGQALHVRNKDGFAHDVRMSFTNSAAFSCLLPANENLVHKVSRAETLPVYVSCLHPWEQGWLVVQDHPYVGISNGDGNLQIARLPTGEWEFQFWHERCGYLKKIVENNESTTWPKGRKTIAIKQGKNDLGPIGIHPELSEQK